MEGYFCNPNHTILYSIVYAVVIGIIFSCFTCSLAALLFFALIVEVLTFSANQHLYRPYLRIPIFLSYVAGWILGRTVFEQEFCFVSWDYDSDRKNCICDKDCECQRPTNQREGME